MLVEFARRRLPFMVESAEKYGDIVFFKVGNERIYLFNHPDLIRDVLVTNQKNFTKSRALVRAKRVLGEGLLTSEGEFHLRQRRLAQPAFHRDRILAYGRSMVDYADRTSSRWGNAQSLDVHEEMMRLTLAIVARTLFSADVENEASEIGEALTVTFEAFNIGILPFSGFSKSCRFRTSRDSRPLAHDLTTPSTASSTSGALPAKTQATCCRCSCWRRTPRETAEA